MSGFALDPAVRRRLGRYDTPEKVALPLVRWGLRTGPGKILDPSFGGCNFLRASLSVLAEAGASPAGQFVFGVDIDQEALSHGLQLVARGVPLENLIIADFFATDPSRIPPVDLVVGNPPYIRHHWFQANSRERAVKALARQNVHLAGRANAWAYFLVHSGAFLRRGGRMALLLPGAVFFADYAVKALDYIRNQAGWCMLARIGKRLFADAEENSVVLLVEDWGLGPCEFAIEDFESIEDLEVWLHAKSERAGQETSTGAQSCAPRELSGLAAETWGLALESPHVQRLGDLAKIRIGVVTGANRFFVRSIEDARRLEGAGAKSAAIVTRGRLLTGVMWGKDDQRQTEEAGLPSRLILAEPGHALAGDLADWVKAGEVDGLPDRFYCRRRKVWYAISDQSVSDAFLHYMGEESPRLVLNRAKSLVTNAIHRVWWRNDTAPPEAAAVGACTSLFALACELGGRRYGGGVLKVEPGEAVRLPVPIAPNAQEGFSELDSLFRAKKFNEARAFADSIVLSQGLGLPQAAVLALRQTAKQLAVRRRFKERI